MSDTMNDEQAIGTLLIAHQKLTCSDTKNALDKAIKHIAARLAQQPADPMFTASMYGSAEAAEKARIAAQQPAAAVPDVKTASVIVPDAPDAHRVVFKVGVQSFHIGPDYFDTKDEADWMAGQFLKALASNAGGLPEVDAEDLRVFAEAHGNPDPAVRWIYRNGLIAYRARLIARMKSATPSPQEAK